jgi:hypothetical protein
MPGTRKRELHNLRSIRVIMTSYLQNATFWTPLKNHTDRRNPTNHVSVEQ